MRYIQTFQPTTTARKALLVVFDFQHETRHTFKALQLLEQNLCFGRIHLKPA